ncbi:SPOR domain-containing protein [Pseudomonas sp. B2M1-30]|uniref:SPOR domain-containing protein n=1 Tax=Pseudomonas koreensis TaxID=198620 RepID=A0A9X3BDR0_9PSED|nr:SPOR domain-containing protein [Pseudomonas botevensis]MBV4475342.1 SPOR domain-containing protein [Pseudomonas botevensis]MCU0121556.1 SPOR domain-containing protein [Pseudomonas sp. B2M1-30]MCU7250940.1 SPOR domain-containing protein [Pseudomonas koreensis]MCU7261284.1 SPOR domain-containing protein [Pseudomonas koreensis]
MRKLVWVVAALVLAGCGEGKSVDAQKPKSEAVAASAVASAPQWDLEVRGETTQAVSDLSGWLIEHAFVPSVIKDSSGNTRILVGPFNSKADAEARQVELNAALVRAKKQNIESLVIERTAAQ